MFSALLCYLWLQQEPPDIPRPPETRPAPVAAPDAGAPTSAPPAVPAEPAPPPAPPPPQSVAPVDAASATTLPETQANVRAPGSSLMNPALSFILDGSFGYYGVRAGAFASLGLPV